MDADALQPPDQALEIVRKTGGQRDAGESETTEERERAITSGQGAGVDLRAV